MRTENKDHTIVLADIAHTYSIFNTGYVIVFQFVIANNCEL